MEFELEIKTNLQIMIQMGNKKLLALTSSNGESQSVNGELGGQLIVARGPELETRPASLLLRGVS